MSEDVIRVCFHTPDPGFAEAVSRFLGAGFQVDSPRLNPDLLARVRNDCDCVLLDLRGFPNGLDVEAGMELLERLRQAEPRPPIVVIAGNADSLLIRRVIEAGASDVLTGAHDMIQELSWALRRADRLYRVEKEAERIRSQAAQPAKLDGLVGTSENMLEIFALVRKVAPCDVNVLITGETGTGKSMLGRALHNLSRRHTGPFVAFSCANLPEHLVEDELFGHEKGAFTGALTLRRGRFEAAEGGTLFLDEVGDLPLGMQAKLLRVLQERTFERLGSNTPLTANVRLICATHHNLEEMVGRSEFREDLYYRLNVIQLHLPPLREREGGSIALAQHLLHLVSQELGKRVTRFSRLAMEALDEYNWPGNVRELENVIRRAVVLADGPTIEVWHLPAKLRRGTEQLQSSRSYEEELREFKRRLVIRTLQKCNGNKAEAARALGLARGYLHRLISDLKIQVEDTAPVAGPELPPAPHIVM